MGCWNTTCGISGLPIHSGEDIVIFMLVQQHCEFMKDFVNINTYFQPVLVPFYGKYNDYGDAEDCSGIGLPLILEALRGKLTEMEVGYNEYHDIEAKRDQIDVAKMFELDREDRLFITHTSMRDPYEFMPADMSDDHRKQVEEQIKQHASLYEPRQLKIVHVQIKRSIFDRIVEHWDVAKNLTTEIEDVIAKGHDRTGRIKRLRKSLKNDNSPEVQSAIAMIDQMEFEDNFRRIAFERLSNPLLSIREIGKERSPELLREATRGAIIDQFMFYIRKPWIKQIGNGSQMDDLNPYRFLTKITNEVMDAEDEEYRKLLDEEDDVVS